MSRWIDCASFNVLSVLRFQERDEKKRRYKLILKILSKRRNVATWCINKVIDRCRFIICVKYSPLFPTFSSLGLNLDIWSDGLSRFRDFRGSTFDISSFRAIDTSRFRDFRGSSFDISAFKDSRFRAFKIFNIFKFLKIFNIWKIEDLQIWRFENFGTL